jgi:hypothetical protein
VGVFGTISVDPAATFDVTLNRLENNVAALQLGDLAGDLGTATKVLVDLTFALDLIARTLHLEIVERHGLDRRWLNARSDFLRLQFRTYGQPAWPHLEAA